MANSWKIHLTQLLVSNMLGESEKPLIFFGDSLEEQEQRISELEEAGEAEALQYLYFLKLYLAIFFHEFELAEECLSKLSEEIEGVWMPW